MLTTAPYSEHANTVLDWELGMHQLSRLGAVRRENPSNPQVSGVSVVGSGNR
jgi:hypothetical protein